MLEGRPTRIATVAVLSVALCGLFVLGGGDRPTPTSATPSPAALADSPGEHVGETVEVGGVVVETEPTIVAVEHGGGIVELELEGAPDAEPGEAVIATGELLDRETVAVDAERTVVRESWEERYMYAVSVLGALVVAIRVCNEWRFRPRAFVFEPRERTFYERWRGDSSG